MKKGDRIVYERTAPHGLRGEYLGHYIKKLRGEVCRVVVDGSDITIDTKDYLVRLAAVHDIARLSQGPTSTKGGE